MFQKEVNGGDRLHLQLYPLLYEGNLRRSESLVHREVKTRNMKRLQKEVRRMLPEDNARFPSFVTLDSAVCAFSLWLCSRSTPSGRRSFLTTDSS